MHIYSLNSHLFSLYNEHHPDVTPHLILRPHTGSDVSSSDDFRNFGSLDLYKNGSVYPEDQAFPITSTSGSSGEEWEINFSVLANASASDYFEIAMSNVDTNNYITLERGNLQVTLLH